MNSVSFLQENVFKSLSYVDQIKIKELGRPIPQLNIEISASSRNKSYKRQFNSNVYTKTEWLCGCDIKNALFCFPCLLFDGDKMWTVYGVTDLGHLNQNISRHERSKKHLLNEVNLALLGKTDLGNQLDPSYSIYIQKHNEQVTKNRYVLSRIIDCIKFCGTFELAVRGHDEIENSESPGVFRGLINFSADLDNILGEHLEQAIFKWTSKDIKNDLLQCMLEVCRNKIIAEINQANYVAVMVDETTDVSSKYQMVVILRYVHEGSPVERFWGFINPETYDTESLTHSIRSIIDPLLKENDNKFVAQAYDGATVMSGNAGVHTRIKKRYPKAHFVHCYAHQLNLIMPQAVSQNSQVRVFFSNVDDVANFFSNSPQKLDMLPEMVGQKILCAVQTDWNYKNRAISIIYEHRISLIEYMQQIQKHFSNAKVINQASALERLLNDDVFLYWLNIFDNIMPEVDILSNQLQRKGPDPVEIVKSAIATFEKCMNIIKKHIDPGIINEEEPLENELELAPRRIELSEENNLHVSALIDHIDYVVKNEEELFENELEFVPKPVQLSEENLRVSALTEDIESVKSEENLFETELEPAPKRIRLSEENLHISALIEDTESVKNKEKLFENELEPASKRIRLSEGNLRTSDLIEDNESVMSEEKLFDNELESSPQRMRLSEENLRISALEVCDVMIQTVKTRFQYTGHLLASMLVFSENFEKYSTKFPDDVFKTTVKAYPVFEVERLRNELSVVYMRDDFRKINGAVAFLNMIRANNLQQPFRETIKLLEIIITIPMITTEADRCFSTLKRVKHFLSNSMCEDRLLELAMLFIEHSFIKNDINFNEKVIEMFANVKQRLDLIFRK